MRRPLLLLVAGLLTLTTVPVSSAPAPAPLLAQTVEGEILLPTRFPLGDIERQPHNGLARAAWVCTSKTNQVIAEVFTVPGGSWGGTFAIDQVSDSTGEGIVDLYFYTSFGDCLGTAEPARTGRFVSDDVAKSGTVPPGTIGAVAVTHNGVGTTFRYRAWEAPRLSLGGPLDLTVVQGNVVTWVNDTEDRQVVRHMPIAGEPRFDSSPKPNSEIPVDGRFSHTFDTRGAFPYETATGTGTITVVASADAADLAD